MKLVAHAKDHYLLYSILALAAFLRFYKADFQSIWVDEILTMNDANPGHSMMQLYNDILFWEQMPHLYFYLTRFVFEIFGFSVLVGRLFSGVLGVLGVYAVYLLAKALYNKNSGLVAALFLAVNYFHIFYSQEMRPYGMFFLFSVLSFYRLVLFIREANLKNAVYYGIFTGLIINSHMFGLVTIFAQCVLLLFYLIYTQSQHRKRFFVNCLVAAVAVLLLAAPGYEAIIHVVQFKSFWLGPPTPNVYTDMFREFFGKSEMVLIAVNVMLLFYIFSVFRQSDEIVTDSVKKNNLLFSAIVLSVWIFITLLLPLLKSYLDVSMILSRYFIGLVAALVIMLAIASQLVRSSVARAIIIIYISGFSLVDLLVVKKYYTTVTKSQIAEMSAEIAKRNPDKSKIVAFWTWLLPHFFANDPDTEIDPISQNFEDYVIKLKTGAAAEKAFWYADANSRPFSLSPESQTYIDQKFILKENLEYFDAWAKYYVPRNAPVEVAQSELSLSMFKPGSIDANGHRPLYNDITLRSELISLQKGNYNLILIGNSFPEKPLNGENAHLTFKWNGNKIGECHLSEKPNPPAVLIPFNCMTSEKGRFEIIYDNDYFLDGKDRNAILHSIKIEKK